MKITKAERILKSKIFFKIMNWFIKLYLNAYIISYDVNETHHLKITLKNNKLQIELNQ